MCKKIGLTLVFWFVLFGLAWAQGMEVQVPDGRTVSLYDDHTWEFKRLAPVPAGDTVAVDILLKNPGRFDGKEVVVTGTVGRFLRAYRLRASSGLTTIVLDVDRARRADQIALEQALAETRRRVRVQARGDVERSLLAFRLVAEDLLVLPE